MKRLSIFFSGGFRPFFWGAAFIAMLNLVIWIAYLSGMVEIHSLFSPTYWHLHEMVFGFIGAAVAGFLLTAVPNWTGRPAIRGLNLALLFGLWALGRVVTFYSEYTGVYFAVMVDLPFLFILCLYIFREIISQGNLRNIPIAVMISVLGLANFLMYAELLWDVELIQYGYRLSIALMSSLIMLIGGRIIPNFTNGWLQKTQNSARATTMNKFDFICIITAVVGLLAWLFSPESIITGGILVVAAVLHGVRLSRWQILTVIKMPILLILQIGYLWLIVGLLLLGGFIVSGIEHTDIAIHALTAGAFTIMIIGVMTRATLGHSGREIIASKRTITVYMALNIAVIARLFAPIWDAANQGLLYISAVAWVVGFGLFILEYSAYFFTSRK